MFEGGGYERLEGVTRFILVGELLTNRRNEFMKFLDQQSRGKRRGRTFQGS